MTDIVIPGRQKRSSRNCVAGLQRLPTVEGIGINAAKRRMLCDLYGGLIPMFDSFFFWRNAYRESMVTSDMEDGALVTAGEEDASQNWEGLRPAAIADAQVEDQSSTFVQVDQIWDRT